MSINAEDSCIQTLPLVTLHGMWDKAGKLLSMSNGITAAPCEDQKARMALSFSTKVPHFVSSRPNGRYVCDSSCIQWKSANICSHTLAVAECNGELKQFVEWYTSSGVSPNITVLGMEGLPKGRAGQKGGRPKKTRSRSVTKPEQLMTITHSCAFSECGPSGVNIGASTNPVHYNVTVPPAARRGPPPLITVPNTSQTPPLVHPSVHPPANPPNVNPFFLKFIQGNIRICQGCRGSLRTSDGALPSPPFDLAVARAEQRPFRDLRGNLITPKRPTIYHYHCTADCIKAAEPNFIPSSIHIPQDILPQLHAAHIDHLMNNFKITIQ